MVLKGVDDIKDTVRTAATSTLRVIGKMTVRMANLDVSSRTTAQRAVDIALPFLIDQGMVNEVKDVQVGLVVRAATAEGWHLTHHELLPSRLRETDGVRVLRDRDHQRESGARSACHGQQLLMRASRPMLCCSTRASACARMFPRSCGRSLWPARRWSRRRLRA